MEPELARFESEQPKVHYTHVDVDKREKSPHKEFYDKYFKGESIPYTVLLDDNDTVQKTWTGSLTYDELVTQIKSLETGEG